MSADKTQNEPGRDLPVQRHESSGCVDFGESFGLQKSAGARGS